MPNTWDFLEEFAKALKQQLISDAERYKGTWLKRFKVGQETRIRERIDTYFDQYFEAGIAVPWLKIAGLALIAWVRENHPEVLRNDEPR